jgi:hypothetical protein
MRLLVIILCVIAVAGCGGGGGGSSAPSAPPAATVSVQTVRLTGEVPVASGTPTVRVNGTVATITGRTWAATVPYADGDYTVDYLVDGVLISREAVDIR